MFEHPIDLSRLKVKGKFTDKYGDEHFMYQDLKSGIKPGWERIFTGTPAAELSDRQTEQIANNGRITASRMEPVFKMFLNGLRDIRILEIGCSNGGVTFALAEMGALEVTGTEFAGYKISSLDQKEIRADQLIHVNEGLKLNRERVAKKFRNVSQVIFKDDDICNTGLEKNHFDLICSWDVLEHLHDPLKAFQNMGMILNEGGIAVHEYNPFFALNGGHSACTIDFPWGHVILDKGDFQNFFRLNYPGQAETAMSFFLNGINRMTIHDLKEMSSKAGLEIVSLIAFPKERDLRMVNKDIYLQAKRNYPDLTLNDLITSRIIVIQRKKG
jgi:SAM-dependent methyltransferase